MECTFKLITICLAVTLSTAQLNYNNPVYVPEYIQTQSSYIEALQQPPSSAVEDAIDAANINIQQLPKPDAPKPFLTSDSQPVTVLRAPTEDAFIADFNTQPYPSVPSQDLQLPSLVQWNPNNDPGLYYPVVVDKVPANLNIPTNVYPKKYNKYTQKVKPSNFKAKDVEITEGNAAEKQKQLDKILYAFAKQENKKLLELEKLAQDGEKVNDPLAAASGFDGFSSSPSSSSFSSPSSHGSDELSHAAFAQGGSNHGGDRMEFHVQGHDGPKSYKWGFDTGKGHNRQFRYEERDKHGIVKGHYGYHDKHGKLRLVHYDSHPHEGFHASDDGAEHY